MLTYHKVDESNPLGNLLHSSISANDKRNPFLYAYLVSLFHKKPQTEHIIYMKQRIRILPFVFKFFFHFLINQTHTLHKFHFTTNNFIKH